MVSSVMAGLGVCMLVLAGIAARQRKAAGGVAVLVAVICLGLAYDNFVIAAGNPMGFGETLEALSAPRFWMHALLTPLLIIAGGVLAGRLGVGWAATRAAAVAGWALVLALMGLGAVEDIVRLSLAPEKYADVLRYTNESTEGPPIPAVVTILVLLALGVMIWRSAGSPWLCLGSITMFAAAAAGVAHPWMGNVGELALQASIVATLSAATRAGSPSTRRGAAPTETPTRSGAEEAD
ncbi:hypothetical protein ABGB12_00530 [Actinocorallia sp. B10E7]|uniref:hypothetical protein n=1 Tax=Actinocorallia sp. B10E7 TaxID=3153558 RepID=UPI00325F5994